MAATSPITITIIILLTFTGDALSDHPTTTTTTTTNLYLSPKTLTTNYNNMLNSFKIFIYQTPSPPPPSTHHSLFYKSLINSHFITQDPNQAHLFFIPFNPSISTRSLARVVKNIRTDHPFWNRTLGADHFYLRTSEGVDLSSDRNIVELKKNSIQISSFPTSYGSFIPHKDITLPHHVLVQPKPLVNDTRKNMFLGYMRFSKDIPLSLSEDIKKSKYFSLESGPLDSKFCLFMYHADVSWIVEAMASRCVPVVITDRPIQDLPLMDVIKWDEVAVFVGPNGGARGIKKVLEGIEDSRYKMMADSGVLATQHLAWSEEPKPYDAFHMIVYQLWLRRHTVRYARWVE